MDRNSTATMEDVGDLKREIDKLRADLRQIRGDVLGLGTDAMHAARVSVSESAKAASTKAKALADATEKQIVTHPFIAVAGAMGVGILLGAIGGAIAGRVTRKD